MNIRVIRLASIIVVSTAALGGCLSSVEPAGIADGLPGQTDDGPLAISGSPQLVAVVNKRYEFAPSTSDADSLTFSIRNKPRWAVFDSTTGMLGGSPTFADVGNHENIVITVSDGTSEASLPAFSIAVSQDGLGAVTLRWDPPQTNTDGSYLTDLAGYKIHFSMESGNYDREIRIDNIGLTSYVVDGLAPATYYFVATAFNEAGVESDYSNEVLELVVIN